MLRLLDLLKKKLSSYIIYIKYLINSRYDIVMVKHTKSQRKEWEELCKFYNETKNNIQKIREKMKKIKSY